MRTSFLKEKWIRKTFGPLYMPVRNSPQTLQLAGGKNAKSQHEPQFLSELTTCKREQKMDDGVLVDMSKKKGWGGAQMNGFLFIGAQKNPGILI